MERKSKKKWTEEELRETYKRLIHQMVDAEDDVERLKEIYTFALYDLSLIHILIVYSLADHASVASFFPHFSDRSGCFQCRQGLI